MAPSTGQPWQEVGVVKGPQTPQEGVGVVASTSRCPIDSTWTACCMSTVTTAPMAVAEAAVAPPGSFQVSESLFFVSIFVI